jgi:cellulose synthase/poly-beta-1,6-N-acetylglucosamine synthase-like glycosyltransferase
MEISECLHMFIQQKNLRVIDFDATTKTMQGKKEPLTIGIQTANHDWILLTDGDCIPERGWIQKMLEQIGEKKTIVLGYAPFMETKGLLNKIQRFDNVIVAIQYLGAALKGKPYMGVGRNLLYHRDLFKSIDGFSKHMDIASGDDDLFVQEIANAQNTTTCLDPASFVYSEAPSTWKEWVHQKRRHLSASSRYKSNVQFRNTLFGASWWIAWLGLPFLLAAAFGYYIIGLIAIIILWALFGRVAIALRQQQLIGLFPLLAIAYCVMLCTFAVLMVRRAPATWTKS